MSSISFSARAWPEALTSTWPTLLILLLGGLALLLTQRSPAPARPPSLRDPIPRLFNTLQFVLWNHASMRRASRALLHRTAAAPALPPGRRHRVQMTRLALPTLYHMSARERRRLWYNYEHIYAEYLGRPRFLRPLVARFRGALARVLLDGFPGSSTRWAEVSVTEFCRRQVVEASVDVLFGPDLIGRSPDFVERFWAFDENVFKLVMGLPRWLDPRPSRTHDRYVAALELWLDHALDGFDWQSAEAEADWEPRFGCRAVREMVRWMKETEWRDETIAATMGALAFALNSNSIPTTTWMLMEIIKDSKLLAEVRDEVASVVTTDPQTGKRTVDSQKVVTLPLLQSIFTETLRLRINFDITRDVNQDIELDGYRIDKGSMLQAPVMVAHYDEAVWGKEGHPASEFWAHRHIKYVDEKKGSNQGRPAIYAMAGRPASFFPFGGGVNICPGRQLAKYEILTTIALIVSQFEIELVGWTKLDGTPSNRVAESDLRYSGAGAMPPDRDMRIRLRRRVYRY
ncbi:putative cytochrome P450 [Xylariomycetidae sp. FL0641]|nr:putative cytochrome P450 [Xylariomycetidae sp. FL0641]